MSQNINSVYLLVCLLHCYKIAKEDAYGTDGRNEHLNSRGNQFGLEYTGRVLDELYSSTLKVVT